MAANSEDELSSDEFLIPRNKILSGTDNAIL